MDLYDKPHPSSWWVFFPLHGLTVDATYDTLGSPLFEGATIISLHYLNTLLGQTNGEDHPNSRSGMLLGPNTLDLRTAVIAIRQTGVINSHPKIVDVFLERIAIQARRRAQHIAALLTVVLLADSRYGETCGMLEQMLVRTEHLAMLEADQTYQMVSVGSKTAACITSGEYETPHLSRSQLEQLLALPHMIGLAQAVTRTRSSYGISLHNSIRQACVRLADAALAVSYSAQLLGAVTSIEILLSGEGEGFKLLQQRLTQLVGKEAAQHHQLKEIFAARHLYVHQGKEIEQRSHALRALLLALQALLIYTQLATQVKTKHGVLHYLDLSNVAQKLAGEWSTERQTMSQTLFTLPDCHPALPFQSYVDDAIEAEEMQQHELAMYFEDGA